MTFHEELSATNLRRLRRASAAGVCIVIGNMALNLSSPAMRVHSLFVWQCVGLVTFALVLVLAIRFAKEDIPLVWRWRFILAAAIALLVVCDGFFFVLWPHFQTISSYSRGMLIAGMLFLMPPQQFIPLACANQIFFTVTLFLRATVSPWIPLMDGSISAVVGSAISWILYHSKRDDFQKRQVIAQQNEEMRELMAIAAHDFRSPLLGIKNLLEFARSRTEFTRERLLGVMDEAVGGCNRLLVLIERLLEAHAAEQAAGGRKQLVDLAERVKTAALRAETNAQLKGLELVTHLPTKRFEALVDGDALDQILDNLISNAVKFSPSGTRITIALAADEQTWRLEIRDQGPGIPEAEQPLLFRKFYRGSNRPTQGEPGAGMGLFIVRSLVEAMDGKIQYLPGELRGAIFRLTFPGVQKACSKPAELHV